MKKVAVMFAVMTVLAGCATGGDPSGAAASKKARVDSKNVPSLTSSKEVYVTDFRVTFITSDSGSAESKSPLLFRGGDGNDGATAILSAKLMGVRQETLQAITDQAYADFLARLADKGYRTLDRSQLDNIDAWKKVKTMTSPNPPFDISDGNIGGKTFLSSDKTRKITFAPSGMPLVKTSEQNLVPYSYGKTAGKAGKPLVRAHYTIHFAYFGSETDYDIDYNAVDMLGREGKRQTFSASVSLGQGIQVIPGAAIEFTVDEGGTFSKSGYVSLKDPVVIGGNYGTNLDTTSSASKAVNALSSLLGTFSGSTSSTKEITIKANPEFYARGVQTALGEANTRLFSGL